ncbi:anthranilate synthase component II [Anaerosacchariphilus polymeriproducens]|uniref:Aminodeoxychorismate/anthranilate synthase component II n=1 Tax=Anaerosacchariphilus polymeriproducens TaxID=1812858 RepID=A0A371AYE8_9FIRM|nr:aminodeoxychorismate/anthranilate synthase component II [Anaerosacchariphilus polymeriproducens]RDU24522.1 aminodeoxychorismate/anthranilate synthase component II [Anaerosacchariphilus polymeriproducens]
MYIMIDNYDSFVYNLAAYFSELGENIQVIRNDNIKIEKLEELITSKQIKGIIISPGPKRPKDCQSSIHIVKNIAGRIPILGVCLGHQIIAHVFGGHISKGERPMHGKVTLLKNSGKNLFKNLVSDYSVTRYHSLIVSNENLPSSLEVDAYDMNGTIMAISHKKYPVYGVQFHPEAILTEYGHELIKNFCDICNNWNSRSQL